MWPKTRRACLRACLRRDVLGRQADTHRQAARMGFFNGLLKAVRREMM